LNFGHWDLPFDSAQGGEPVEPFVICNLLFVISGIASCKLSFWENTKTLWILPRSSSPSSSHLKTDECACEEEQDHMSELGKGNQNQQDLAGYNVRYHH
jgi:hypothetical protein